MSDCIFCKIVSGDIPSKKIYEDELCYAFYDINPQSDVHFLVIPKTHDLTAVKDVTEETANVVAHIFKVIAELTCEMNIESYRVITNCGEGAGQTVMHLHFHVLSGNNLTENLV